MKKTLTFLIAGFFTFTCSAQSVGEKVNQRVQGKTDEAIDKGLNKAEQTLDSLLKKKDKKGKTTTAETGNTNPGNHNTGTNNNGTNNPNNTSSTNQTSSQSNQSSAQTKSFSDFVPGATLILFDDFKQDALADFPAKWNTNGSGKIVTISGQEGKWLDIAHGSVVNPVLDKPLPENATIEFDLFLQVEGERLTPYINFGLTPVKDVMREDLAYKDKFFVGINRYNENDGRTVEYGLKEVVGNKNDFPLPSYLNKVLHVSMAINKTRIRVYFDQTKLIDLPRALTPELRNNFYLANMGMVPASELGVLVSNLRIASSETDARSLLIKQLMDEGKAVTNDILFDVNSDVIKPESYPVVNQFGEALKTNTGLKIKITGHTDSDGTPASNLELSKNRANAVKKHLQTNYSVEPLRIQTDGKGATQPVSDNNTAEGKAKNRRVEFVKL